VFLNQIKSQNNGDTRRHVKCKSERAGILPFLGIAGNLNPQALAEFLQRDLMRQNLAGAEQGEQSEHGPALL